MVHRLKKILLQFLQILCHGLFFLNLYIDRQRTHQHSHGALQPEITASVIDRTKKNLCLSIIFCKSIGKRSQKQRTFCNADFAGEPFCFLLSKNFSQIAADSSGRMVQSLRIFWHIKYRNRIHFQSRQAFFKIFPGFFISRRVLQPLLAQRQIKLAEPLCLRLFPFVYFPDAVEKNGNRSAVRYDMMHI